MANPAGAMDVAVIILRGNARTSPRQGLAHGPG